MRPWLLLTILNFFFFLLYLFSWSRRDKNWIIWKKFVYVLNYLKRQCTKTIHGCTHHNKIKKSCWRQLPISKSLLPYGHRDSNRASFIIVYQKGCFWSKTKKSEHHHWILDIRINLGTNFSLNQQFWFLGPNLPKSVFSIKKKKWIPPLNSAYSN